MLSDVLYDAFSVFSIALFLMLCGLLITGVLLLACVADIRDELHKMSDWK